VLGLVEAMLGRQSLTMSSSQLAYATQHHHRKFHHQNGPNGAQEAEAEVEVASPASEAAASPAGSEAESEAGLAGSGVPSPPPGVHPRFPWQIQLALTIPKQPGSINQGLHRDGDLTLVDFQAAMKTKTAISATAAAEVPTTAESGNGSVAPSPTSLATTCDHAVSVIWALDGDFTEVLLLLMVVVLLVDGGVDWMKRGAGEVERDVEIERNVQ
jgi:hypothetical protein